MPLSGLIWRRLFAHDSETPVSDHTNPRYTMFSPCGSVSSAICYQPILPTIGVTSRESKSDRTAVNLVRQFMFPAHAPWVYDSSEQATDFRFSSIAPNDSCLDLIPPALETTRAPSWRSGLSALSLWLVIRLPRKQDVSLHAKCSICRYPDRLDPKCEAASLH